MRKEFASILCLVLVLAAGCSQRPTDITITTDIKSKMYSDPELKALSLDIAVKNGEVTLSGEVPTAELQLKAYKLAGSIVGVSKVHDAMKVQDAQARESMPLTAPAPPANPQPEPTRERKAPPIRTQPRLTARDSATPAASTSTKPPASAPSTLPPVAAQAENRDQQSRVEAAAQPPTPPTREAMPATSVSPPRPHKVQVTIPADTIVAIRMVDAIDSSINKVGEVFRATLDNPILVEGKEIVPAKADVFVELVQARSAGRMSGQSELELSLHSLEFAGQTYQLSSTTYEQVGKSRGKDTALKVGIASGIGAAIGAIAGGGKGAAIGAGVGAGAGVAVQVATRGQQVKVPTETQLEFTLKNPFSVTYTNR